MKKPLRIILALLLIFVYVITISGCENTQYVSSSQIARPRAKAAPLQGTWKVRECITGLPGAPQESIEDTLKDMEVGFTYDAFTFDKYMWNNVSYKVKKVNTEEYFLHRYRDASYLLNITDDEIYVVQVASGDKLLYEFVKINDSLIAANVDNNIYCLDKLSDSFDAVGKVPADDESPDIILENGNDSKQINSGIFLSFRVPLGLEQLNNSVSREEYRYQTYWIAFIGGILRPVLTAPDIFMPRKDGFWKVRSRKDIGNTAVSEVIQASRVSSKGSESIISTNPGNFYINGKRMTRNRAILYLGNDFICFEDSYYAMDEPQQSPYKKELRTLPIDSMDELDGIRLSDIAGQNGSMAFEGAMADLIKYSKSSELKNINDYNMEQNFALFRKTGHWFLKGRINFGKDSPVPYSDFNLNLLPPSNMVAYDTLHVPWTIIKDRIPQAIDEYTSPNKDLAIILTRNTVYIYAIIGNDIAKFPLMQFPIPDGSSVVMAEWGTGSYTQKWEKAFIDNNPVIEIK